MKNLKIYINTIYKPAFITLCAGLALFAIALGILAVNLHTEILTGESDVIYRYPDMIEKILFPLYILLPTVFIVDLNERKRKAA